MKTSNWVRLVPVILIYIQTLKAQPLAPIAANDNRNPAGLLLMNGMPQPATMRLQAGTTYRFRFMNITPTMDNMRVSLRGAAGAVEWRLLAKDAANVKSPAPQKADQHIAVGETFDFEYRAAVAGELRLEGWSPGDNRRAVQTLVFAEP